MKRDMGRKLKSAVRLRSANRNNSNNVWNVNSTGNVNNNNARNAYRSAPDCVSFEPERAFPRKAG
jgi:hypothetical protein